MVVHEEEPFNAEPEPGVLLESDLTRSDAFYSRNHGPIPNITASDWRLEVGGLVDRPLRLSLTDLQDRFEHCELTATLQCAGNQRAGLMAVRDIPGEDPWGPGATSTARWGGAALADVLEAAGMGASAAHVEFLGLDISQVADPPQVYGSSIARHKAIAPETLLAWEMNGEPLPRLHGGPVRVVVPGYIGARSVKWVNQINALTEPSDNYFQATAYRVLPPEADPSAAAPGDGISLGAIAVNSAILTPDEHGTVPPGPSRIAGYALAGDDRTIERVDVSIDGGKTWVQAALDPQSSPWSWRHWHTTITFAPERSRSSPKPGTARLRLNPNNPVTSGTPKVTPTTPGPEPTSPCNKLVNPPDLSGTGTGTARVTDALNVGTAGRLPWSELVRRVDGIDGHVTIRWKITLPAESTTRRRRPPDLVGAENLVCGV